MNEAIICVSFKNCKIENRKMQFLHSLMEKMEENRLK